MSENTPGQLSPLAIRLRRSLTPTKAVATGEMLMARPASLDSFQKLDGLSHLLRETAAARPAGPDASQLDQLADIASDFATHVFAQIPRDQLPEGGSITTNRIEAANLLATDGEAVGLIL